MVSDMFPTQRYASKFLLFCLAVTSGMAADSGSDAGLYSGRRHQPQAVVDSRGMLHLIYYKGDPHGGDIWYARRPVNENEFPHPLRVNSQLGSAIAAGSIRGAQLAIGKNRRVHVVWTEWRRRSASKIQPKGSHASFLHAHERGRHRVRT